MYPAKMLYRHIKGFHLIGTLVCKKQKLLNAVTTNLSLEYIHTVQRLGNDSVPSPNSN